MGKKRLNFNFDTGKLTAIETYEKTDKGLRKKEEKHYYPNRKLSSIDVYKEGKLVKSSSFQEDGKTLKWVSEYLDGQDIVTEFYPDGKTTKFLTVDCADYTNKYEYDETGDLVSQEYYLNDVIVIRTTYDKKNGTESVKNYEEGKLKTEYINHTKGQIKRRDITYDENENTKTVKIYYNDPLDYAEADYEGDTVVLRRYYNNILRYTETKNRKTGEKKVVYSSKKPLNVKKS